MKIICCAIHYPTDTPYSGAVSNVPTGEIYIGTISHAGALAYCGKLHLDVYAGVGVKGYLAVQDDSVIFVSRVEAAKADNLRSVNLAEVYSYHVDWNALDDNDHRTVTYEINRMRDMLLSKGMDV